jgi:hypothetical protein
MSIGGGRFRLIAAAVAAAAAVGAVAPALAGPAPEVDLLVRDLSALPWVSYGDGRSYSLPIANFYWQLNGGGGTPYKVPISDANKSVMVASDEGGFRTLPKMENPYNTPTGASSLPPDRPWFATVPETYQGCDAAGCPTTQIGNSWDVDLSALKTYLTVSGQVWDPVFYFQNNNINNAGSFNQSLAAWARLWITDANGNDVANSNFLFTNDNKPYRLVSEGGGGIYLGDVNAFSSTATAPKAGGTPNATDFVLSGGDICVAYSTTNTVRYPVPVPCGSTVAQAQAIVAAGGFPNPGDFNAVSAPIVHNLGNNEFPYAVVFPELNDLIRDLNWGAGYTLHVDVRLGCGTSPDYPTPIGDDCFTEASSVWGNALNNGGESIAIGATRISTDIPEPASIALTGLALVGMAGAMRRRRRSA